MFTDLKGCEIRDSLCHACSDLFQRITGEEPHRQTQMCIVAISGQISGWEMGSFSCPCYCVRFSCCLTFRFDVPLNTDYCQCQHRDDDNNDDKNHDHIQQHTWVRLKRRKSLFYRCFLVDNDLTCGTLYMQRCQTNSNTWKTVQL